MDLIQLTDNLRLMSVELVATTFWLGRTWCHYGEMMWNEQQPLNLIYPGNILLIVFRIGDSDWWDELWTSNKSLVSSFQHAFFESKWPCKRWLFPTVWPVWTSYSVGYFTLFIVVVRHSEHLELMMQHMQHVEQQILQVSQQGHLLSASPNCVAVCSMHFYLHRLQQR